LTGDAGKEKNRLLWPVFLCLEFGEIWLVLSPVDKVVPPTTVVTNLSSLAFFSKNPDLVSFFIEG
jgi:hypothetical protein